MDGTIDMPMLVKRGQRVDWKATRDKMEQDLHHEYERGEISTDVFLRRSEDLAVDFERLRLQYGEQRRRMRGSS